jgi:hypothetical protein
LKQKKPNRIQTKPGKTKANREKPSQTEKTKPNRFEPVFVLKNRTEPKMIILTQYNNQQQHQ